MPTTYKIHPAIGVARAGTSAAFYLTPESGGALPTDPVTGQPVTSFRDASGNMLRQAQRFRVFAYDDANPGGVEVQAGTNGVAAIEWTVYLANKKAVWYQFEQLTGSGQEGDPGYVKNGPKLNPLRNAAITDPAARQALILDPGPRTIGGSGNPSSAELMLGGDPADPAKMLPNPVTMLGSIQLDANGNLLVVGSDGAAGTLNVNPPNSPYQYYLLTYANNDGWFDSMADGPVTAALVMSDGTKVPVDTPAWCLAGPPKYAPQIVNLVTLHDLMYDIAVREMNYDPALFANGAFNPDYEIDFASQILPILTRPEGYHWVADIDAYGVASHEALPQNDASNFPISRLRPPGATNSDFTQMPRLAGDNPISNDIVSKYLTVTETQFFFIQQWMAGKVRSTPLPPPPRAAQLDQGALDNCVGGAFCPGIEMTWVSRNTTIYAAPFRIRVSAAITPGKRSQTNGDDNDYSKGLEPGDIIKYMAQPWQADFNECSTQDITHDPSTNTGLGGGTTTFWWWPAERPYAVFTAADGAQVPWTRGFQGDPNNVTPQTPNLGDMQMVVSWKDLGFIFKEGSAFLEIERNTAGIAAYKPPLKPNTVPIGAAPAGETPAAPTPQPATPPEKPLL
jgi:L-Lysine epsilon oxidase N-terminal/L-lysine epsilon oxidase C-terminal domain